MTATTRPTTLASAVEGFRPWWLWIVTAVGLLPPATSPMRSWAGSTGSAPHSSVA